MADYLADPAILQKNYIVIGDFNTAMKQLEKSKSSLEAAKASINQLADEVYPNQTLVEQQYTTQTTEKLLNYFNEQNVIAQRSPIQIRVRPQDETIVEYRISENQGKCPPINQLSGFNA